MSTESKGIPPGLPLLAALVLLGAGGLFLKTAPLKPLRTGSPALWSEPESGAGKAPARLWQDPLQAVMPAYLDWKKGRDEAAKAAREAASKQVAQQKTSSSPDPQPTPAPPSTPTLELVGGLRDRLAQQSEPWLLLIALVSSGNYADSEASRLDNRYALLSALGEGGYVPEEREHLGFFIWNRLDVVGEPQFAIPYEWYRREASTADETKHVMVAWVRNDAIRSSHAIHDVDEFSRALGREDKGADAAQLRIVLLTSGSNRLIDISHELFMADGAFRRSDRLWSLLSIDGGLTVLDWSATITKSQLLAAVAARVESAGRVIDGAPESKAETVENTIEHAAFQRHIRVERLIGTDGELLHLLGHELSLRRIAPGAQSGWLAPKSHIAVIHEWDTAYGRSIPDAFLRQLAEAALEDDEHPHSTPEPTATQVSAEMERLRAYVHPYEFMKGVDGVLPAEATKSSTAGEAPEGRSQLDYVRRLADRIDQERRGWDDGRLAAIGVFGDVYDKVPILQAMHEKFPEAVLLTTDLEARLLKASSDASLRNLLVASHYGLRLDVRLQQTTPPFRSSYQTSLFAATQLALHGRDGWVAAGLALDEGRAVQLDGRPHLGRVYELAQSGPYDLRCAEAAPNALLHPGTDLPFKLGWKWALCGSLAIFAALGLGLYASRVSRSDEPSSRMGPSRGAFGIVMPVLAVIALVGAASIWPLFNRDLWGPIFERALIGHSSVHVVADVLLIGAALALARVIYCLMQIGGGIRQSTARRIVLALVALVFVGTMFSLESIRPSTTEWWGVLIGGLAGGIGGACAAARSLRMRTNVMLGLAAGTGAIGSLIIANAQFDVLSPSLRLADLAAKALILASVVAMGLVADQAFEQQAPPPSDPGRIEWRDLFRTRNLAVLGTAIAVFLAASRGIEALQTTNDQEPVALWDGISAWPSIGLRLLVVVAGCWFLFMMREDARNNVRRVTESWCLLRDGRLKRWMQISPFRRARLLSTIGWTPESVAFKAASSRSVTYGQTAWLDYVARGRTIARALRGTLLILLFAALVSPIATAIWWMATGPAAPRGVWAHRLHSWSFLLSTAIVAIVTLAVWEASNLAQRFIAILKYDWRQLPLAAWQKPFCWHKPSLEKVEEVTGLRGAAADTYLTIRVIADRTRWVSATIYYPFVLLVMMLLANASGFDSWPRSWGIIALLAVPALIAVLSARALQTCARQAREELLIRLLREIGRPIKQLTLTTDVAAKAPAPTGPAVEVIEAAVAIVEARVTKPNGLRPDLTPVDGGSGDVGVLTQEVVTTSQRRWTRRVLVYLGKEIQLPVRRPHQAERTAPRAIWTVTDRGASLAKDDVDCATKFANAIHHGAFSFFTDNPAVRALLLPFGGFGAIQVIDAVMKVM